MVIFWYPHTHLACSLNVHEMPASARKLQIGGEGRGSRTAPARGRTAASCSELLLTLACSCLRLREAGVWVLLRF